MRVLQVGELEGRYVASLAEAARPVPREGEVLVRVAASGVNRADLLPLVPGRHDFAEQIEERWGREAVDVVLAPTGAPSVAGDMRVLATGGRGRVVFISTMAGARAEVDLALVMRKRARLLGSTLRARSRAEKGAIVARFKREILAAFASDELRVPVDTVFPVDRAAEAFQRMRENRNVGKILIAWPRD